MNSPEARLAIETYLAAAKSPRSRRNEELRNALRFADEGNQERIEAMIRGFNSVARFRLAINQPDQAKPWQEAETLAKALLES
jgi:hypothetical protein